MPRIHGIDLDEHGRCAHYRTPIDIVAIRLYCCGRYYACHLCHGELADHPAAPWPRDHFGARAILCGACRNELTISEYLDSPDACLRCNAAFNPRCIHHHPLYFALTPPAPPLREDPPHP